MQTIRDDVELSGTADHDGGRHPVSSQASPCPFAPHGLDSASMPMCPGFEAVAVSFTGFGAGESLGDHVTCAHLGTQRGGRGFLSACRHPGGLPQSAPELARRAERASRRAPSLTSS